MDTDFKLGQKIEDDDGNEIEMRFIWPICLPKNNAGDDGFVTGWLDTPPVSQQNRRLLGKVSDSVDGIRSVIFFIKFFSRKFKKIFVKV